MSSGAFHYAIVDEVDSILIDEARTPLIISGPVEHSENKMYVEVKPQVINLKKKQGTVIRSILQEAKEMLEVQGMETRALSSCSRSNEGIRRTRSSWTFIAQNQSLKKEVDRLEAMLSAQKVLPEIDQDLYCTIDERSNAVELTEKGIKLLSAADSESSSSRTWMKRATSFGRTKPHGGGENRASQGRGGSVYAHIRTPPCHSPAHQGLLAF